MRPTFLQYLLILVLLGWIPWFSAMAIDGALDPSFGGSQAASGADDRVDAILTQFDGQVIVGGRFRSVFGKARPGLFRLQLNGELDPTFGVSLPFDPPVGVTALAQDAEGRLLVALVGRRSLQPGVISGLVRLSSSGELDGGFGEYGFDGSVRALAVEGDGRILAAGDFSLVTSGQSLFPRDGIARLSAGGGIDLEFNPELPGPVHALALDRDHRILVGFERPELRPDGGFGAVAENAAVVRLKPSGEVDPSFRPGRGPNVIARAISMDPAGRFVLVGKSDVFFKPVFGAPPDVFEAVLPPSVVRLQEDGQPDAAFVGPDLSYADAMASVVRLPGGSYLLGRASRAGSSGEVERVMRLHPDGTQDLGFKHGASVLSPSGEEVRALGLDAQGRLIVGGLFSELDGQPRRNLGRLENTLPAHVADPAFLPDPQFLTPGLSDVQGAVAEPGGGVVVFGSLAPASAGATRPVLRRLAADGSADESFQVVADGVVTEVVRQPDGQLLLLGGFQRVNGVARPHLARVRPDGQVDRGFGPLTLNEPTGRISRIRLAPDGRIYVMGTNRVNGLGQTEYLCRLFPDGSVDRSFRLPGLSADPAQEASYVVHDVAALADGSVVVAGDFTQLSGLARTGVAKLMADGSLDDGFRNVQLDLALVRHLSLDLPEETVLALGAFTRVGLSNRPGLARFTRNGVHVGAFVPELLPGAVGLGRDPDQRILVLRPGNRPGEEVALRLGTNGRRDLTFVAGLSGDQAPRTFVAASDGAHYLAGPFRTWDGRVRPGVVRLLPDRQAPQIGATLFSPSLRVPEKGPEGSPPQILLRRTKPLGTVYTVKYEVESVGAKASEDFVAVSGAVTFRLGDTQASFPLPVIDDALVEGDETLRVRLSSTNGAVAGPLDEAWVTVEDDERPAGALDLDFVPPEPGVQDGSRGGEVKFLLPLPDGGLVAAGFFTQFGDVVDLTHLVKFRPNGAVDLRWRPQIDRAIECPPVLAANGDVVVGGPFRTVNRQPQAVVARLNPTNGLVVAGFRALSFSHPEAAASRLLMQPNGRILMAGAFGRIDDGVRPVETGEQAVVRLLADGRLDPDFVSFPVKAFALALGPNQEIYVGGQFNLADRGGVQNLARLLPNGSLDPSFKTSMAGPVFVTETHVLADGRLVIAGNFYEINGVNRASVARLFPDGTVDPTLTVRMTADVDWLRTMPDGRMVAGGMGSHVDGAYRPGVFRLLSDGSLDRSFRPGVEFGDDQTVRIGAGGLDAQGRVLVAGGFLRVSGQEGVGLARLLGSPSSPEFNLPPEVTWVSPTSDTPFAQGTAVRLEAVALDAGGIARVEFRDGDRLLGEVTTPPYGLTVSDLGVGEHGLTVVAVDVGGLSTTNGPVPIQVIPGRPSVQWAMGEASVEEDGNLSLSLIKTGGPAVVVRVKVEDGGSATPGLDYPASQTKDVPLPEGSSLGSVSFQVFDDFLGEADETFVVGIVLLQVEGGDAAAVGIGTPSQVRVTIVDDDQSVGIDSFPVSGLPAGDDGFLRVVLEQAAGVEGRGGWRLAWERNWRQGGALESPIPFEPGTHDLYFKPLVGSPTPPVRTVSVVAAGEAVEPFTYPAGPTPMGKLEVQMRRRGDGPDGSEPVTEARWKLNGEGPPRPGGLVAVAVPAGRHLVQFDPVLGLGTPETQEAVVAPGQTVSVTGWYGSDSIRCEDIAVTVPARVSRQRLEETVNPVFRAIGQLGSEAGAGSGVAVRERVVLTAAHLVFDPVTLSPVVAVDWRAGRMRGVLEPRPRRPRGWYVLSGYAEQRALDRAAGLGADQASEASAERDAAALWFVESAARGAFAGYLVSDNPSAPGERLVAAGSKSTLGYPLEGLACGIRPGELHEVVPFNYSFQPVPERPGLWTTAGFRSFPGHSGGPVFAQAPGQAPGQVLLYPAGIYLGDGPGSAGQTVSRVRVIDRDVLTLINLAASSANVGTNYAAGGVARFQTAQPGLVGLGGVQVRFVQSAVAAQARWYLVGTNTPVRGTNGAIQLKAAPSRQIVRFDPVPGFQAPADVEVGVEGGQVAVLEVTYSLDLVDLDLRASVEEGLRVTGSLGLKVELQFRPALVGGADWARVKQVTLGAGPVTLLAPGFATDTAGFYRVAVVP